MDIERPDTTPGFEMESPNFNLSFVTGLQRGVASSMLEMETDWYDKLLLNLAIQPLKNCNIPWKIGNPTSRYGYLSLAHSHSVLIIPLIAEIHDPAQV